MKRLLGLVLSVFVVGSVSQAQSSLAAAHGFRSDAEMANYLTVANARIEEVPLTAQQLEQYAAMPATLPNAIVLSTVLGGDLISTLGPVLADPSGISGWIALGKKAWDVVVANKPVVNVSTTRISVLPNDKSAWGQMSGWQRPYARSFSYVATNLLGLDVVKQTYTLTYNYGGQLNGKGAFLANATIIPSDINVMWGYELDTNVQVGQIVNIGTVENPIPGVEFQLKRTVKTILREETSTDCYFIQGNGAMKQITL